MAREDTREMLVRIDENVKAIKCDFMTRSKTDLCVERLMAEHVRVRHKPLSTQNIITALVAAGAVLAMLAEKGLHAVASIFTNQ